MKRVFYSILLVFILFNLSIGETLLEKLDREKIQLVNKVLPGVVTINVVKEVIATPPLPIPPEFLPPDFKQKFEAKAVGSGFIVKVDYRKRRIFILTNNHVIENAKKIIVWFQNNKRVEGFIVGRDKESDIAVISVPFKNGIQNFAKKHVLSLGNSDNLKIGQTVFAIGSPLGLKGTVTMGIISALNRNMEISSAVSFIQTDAPINPGNSGGPLVNIKGEVVGINTAILAGAQGLGFAVPINDAKWVMGEILRYGHVRRSYIGVLLQPLTPDLASYFKIKNGVIIAKVFPNTPASRSGLKPGDILVAVNNKPVNSINDAVRYITRNPPGTKLSLKIYRNGKYIIIPIKTSAMGQRVSVKSSSIKSYEEKYGLKLLPAREDILRKYNLPKVSYGVIVFAVKAGSPADEAGLVEGDIILQVDRHPIHSPTEFWNYIKIAERKGKDKVLLYVKRGDIFIFRVLRIIK